MSVDRTAATRSETSTHRRVFSASATPGGGAVADFSGDDSERVELGERREKLQAEPRASEVSLVAPEVVSNGVHGPAVSIGGEELARVFSRGCAVLAVAHGIHQRLRELINLGTRSHEPSPGAVRVEDGSGDGVYARGRRRWTLAGGNFAQEIAPARGVQVHPQVARFPDHTSPRRARGLATHEGRGVLERGEDEPKDLIRKGRYARSIQPRRHRPRRDLGKGGRGGWCADTAPSQVLLGTPRATTGRAAFLALSFLQPARKPAGSFLSRKSPTGSARPTPQVVRRGRRRQAP